MRDRPTTAPRPVLVWASLATLYLAWGSTYLAIRVMVETIPPLLGAGVRFLLAGAILYAALAVVRGRAGIRVGRREAAAAATVGVFLLCGGIGLLTVAEEDVPSGLAAVLIASIAVWVVLLSVVARERVSRTTVAGVAMGLVGVGVLAVPGSDSTGAPLSAVALVLAAAVSTAIGTVLSPRLPIPRDALLGTAIQMLTSGAALALAAVGTGEITRVDLGDWSLRSVVALGYLVFVGSLVAYTAFVWLLANVPVSTVSTYVYVNPVVAIFLGWAVLSEEVTTTILLGTIAIVASVSLVVRSEGSSGGR